VRFKVGIEGLKRHWLGVDGSWRMVSVLNLELRFEYWPARFLLVEARLWGLSMKRQNSVSEKIVGLL
jgi:hypothetical protein